MSHFALEQGRQHIQLESVDNLQDELRAIQIRGVDPQNLPGCQQRVVVDLIRQHKI